MTDHIVQAALHLVRAANIETMREIKEKNAATNHGREFVNSKRLLHIRTAINALSQIDNHETLEG